MTKPVLAVTLAPFEDESIRSWLDRLAARHRVSFAEMTERLGISRVAAAHAIPDDYAVTLTPKTLAEVARIADQPADAIAAMLLVSFAGVTTPEGWAPTRHGNCDWVYRTGSHFCPECLSERHGAWKLSWKLPWSFVCTDHGTWLLSHCPDCGRRAGGDQIGGRRPALPTRIPKPGHCSATIPTVGTRSVRCDADLTAVNAPTVDDDRILNAQCAIDLARTKRIGKLAGSAVTSVDFFAALRSIAALWSLAGTADDLATTDELATAGVHNHIKRRESTVSKRNDHYATGRRGHTAPKFRYWRQIPIDPALIGALMVASLPIVTGLDDKSLRLLAPLVRDRRRAGVRKLVKDFHVPDVIADAIIERNERVKPIDAAKVDIAVFQRLELRHVPALFWEDVYLRHIEPVLPRGRGDRRRFASIAIARHITGLSWYEAAKATHNPEMSRKMFVHVGKLRDRGSERAFSAAIAAAAADLEQNGPLIDFGERRRIYESWVLPEADWQAICAKTGVSPGIHYRNASAYLWQEIVGDHWADAPCWASRPQHELNVQYNKSFVRVLLPKIKPVLDAYANAVVTYDRQAFDMLPTLPMRAVVPFLVDARPDLATEWDLTHNRKFTPANVAANSERLVWWRCSAGHIWQARVLDRAKQHGKTCPSCASPPRTEKHD